jgi:hypothetical protein
VNGSCLVNEHSNGRHLHGNRQIVRAEVGGSHYCRKPYQVAQEHEAHKRLQRQNQARRKVGVRSNNAETTENGVERTSVAVRLSWPGGA